MSSPLLESNGMIGVVYFYEVNQDLTVYLYQQSSSYMLEGGRAGLDIYYNMSTPINSESVC